MRTISALSRLLASTLRRDELYEARLVEALDAIEEFLASVRGAPARDSVKTLFLFPGL